MCIFKYIVLGDIVAFINIFSIFVTNLLFFRGTWLIFKLKSLFLDRTMHVPGQGDR